MANIVVTSSTNYIKAVFNDMATAAGADTGYWAKSTIEKVVLRNDGAVEVVEGSSRVWVLDLNGTLGAIVDTVDGATPSSNSDLMDKLATAIW